MTDIVETTEKVVDGMLEVTTPETKDYIPKVIIEQRLADRKKALIIIDMKRAIVQKQVAALEKQLSLFIKN